MTHRTRDRTSAARASSPAALSLFLAAILGPILVFAFAMRLLAG
ncbi:hypothetical protein [Sandarakinorhabdus sp. DWP1-3-1]